MTDKDASVITVYCGRDIRELDREQLLEALKCIIEELVELRRREADRQRAPDGWVNESGRFVAGDKSPQDYVHSWKPVWGRP